MEKYGAVYIAILIPEGIATIKQQHIPCIATQLSF